jgi:hypothetical protein
MGIIVTESRYLRSHRRIVTVKSIPHSTRRIPLSRFPASSIRELMGDEKASALDELKSPFAPNEAAQANVFVLLGQ